MSSIRDGALHVRDGWGEATFGTASGGAVELHVADPRTYTALAASGTLGAASAYLNGWWECDDLVALFRLLTRNAPAMASLDQGIASWLTRAQAWLHRRRRNTLPGSRRNIHAHYDLGDDFFSLFLDETMAYSSGVFPRPAATLAEASVEKFERMCRLLRLTPSDHVLEIGTGWGGFALHAARHYGCRVTTTTISRNQHAFALRRVREAGLDERVRVLCEDYRELRGVYDKIVSIEMIEAVGHEFLDVFFRQCSALLRPGGTMALQTITLPDARYDAYRRSVDFIQKYIFPGGCIPSLGALAAAIGRASDLRVTRLHDFGLHYAETLRHWRLRFWDNIEAVRALGYDERFIRMWHYYLCYCEAGFLDKQIGLAQILLEKPETQSEDAPCACS